MSKRSPEIAVARVYEDPEKHPGYRVLVDRLWPRGVKKADLKLDAWLKDVAPSGELRKWFGHDPAKWQEFRKRYLAELHRGSEQLGELLEVAREKPLVLLYSAKDEEHNQALVLREFLLSHMKATQQR